MSLNVVVYTIIAGVGFVHGAFIAALLAPSTLIAYFLPESVNEYLALVGGVLVVATLALNPDGLGAGHVEMAHRLLRRGQRSTTDEEASSRVTGTVAVEEPARLEAVGLTVRYGGVTAVNQVSLELSPGRITGLIGPNGAGKTSCIDALTGLAPLSSGTISLNGQRIERMSPAERARSGVGRTFQSLDLFDDLTVRENLLVATDHATWQNWLVAAIRPKASSMTAETWGIVDRFELEPWLDMRPSQLPYGVRRLVGLARAVAARTPVLLLDEPAAGLDEHETAELGLALRWLADECQHSILLVEHDIPLVSSIVDDLVVIDFGTTIFRGSATEAMADSVVRSAYLGDVIEERSVEPQR
jgi:sulfate-transporting ATPase